VAAVAYVFADYAAPLADLGPHSKVALAALAVAALTAVNLLGVHPGRRTQNFLTTVKVIALAGVILAGFLGPRSAPPEPTPADAGSSRSFGLALVFVLFSYGGWHEGAYVTAEVRSPRRNVPRALLAGTAVITVLYVLINAAYLAALGYEGARTSRAVAEDVLRGALGSAAGRVMAALVVASALGSLNGSLFTGARIYQELGVDHPLLGLLAVRDPRHQTPFRALVLQAVVALALVLAVGLLANPNEAFERLVTGTTPVFCLFLMLTGLALFVLRWRNPGARPPFPVPGYPVVPLLFCGWSGYLLWASVVYAREQALVGLAILAAGVPAWLISRALEGRRVSPPP
jgi:amino acid transporter